jgi:hypothetical protein
MRRIAAECDLLAPRNPESMTCRATCVIDPPSQPLRILTYRDRREGPVGQRFSDLGHQRHLIKPSICATGEMDDRACGRLRKLVSHDLVSRK